MIMKQVCVFFLVLTLLALGMAQAQEAEQQIKGTTVEELKASDWPDPSTVKVAILPLRDVKGMERHTQVATGAVALAFMRCGFQFAPELERRDMDGLAAVLVETANAVAEDKQIAPDESLRLGDAVRIGEGLGADWVVYGEVLDLHTYEKRSFFSIRKKAVANIKVKVADVRTGELVMSRQKEDKGSGGGAAVLVRRKGTAMERTICTRCCTDMYRDLCGALPSHKHDPDEEWTEQDVLALEEAWNRIAPRESE
jgi:hypothetical protein